MAFRRKRGDQLGVALVAGGRVEERVQEARRRALGAGRVELHAEGSEDLPHMGFETGPLFLADMARMEAFPAAIGFVCFQPHEVHQLRFSLITKRQPALPKGPVGSTRPRPKAVSSMPACRSHTTWRAASQASRKTQLCAVITPPFRS